MKTLKEVLNYTESYDSSKVAIDAIDMASRDIERYGDFVSREDFAGKWLTKFAYVYEGSYVEFLKVRGRTIEISKKFSDAKVKSFVSEFKNTGNLFSKDTRKKTKKVNSYKSSVLVNLIK